MPPVLELFKRVERLELRQKGCKPNARSPLADNSESHHIQAFPGRAPTVLIQQLPKPVVLKRTPLIEISDLSFCPVKSGLLGKSGFTLVDTICA